MMLKVYLFLGFSIDFLGISVFFFWYFFGVLYAFEKKIKI